MLLRRSCWPDPDWLQTAARCKVSETSFLFEIFDPTQPVEHTFHFYNTGAETIQVERIALTPPLGTKQIISKIPPEQEGH